ncbi:hypothetical protein [Acanthopleuribacter pedis]|uniref:Uncharacterized protein n=1 Tax=Acanthopleuribacter pedis TaxID=442870 RepID=A0A8J7QSQ7_9BACT|nr:hypothetical protein [Acanthopleuribacter pedis]MBO1323485.1 hypothetical protein [Acanthopleuribacter pedis]
MTPKWLEKSEMGVLDYGLLSVSCLAKPKNFLPLKVEIEEFLRQYSRKLRSVHKSYLEAKCDDASEKLQLFDDYMKPLYKPRFGFSFGNQDLRGDCLVDDFELLLNLPIFSNTTKQHFHLSLFPDFLEDPEVRAMGILDPKEFFRDFCHEREVSSFQPLWPIQTQVIFRMDLWLKMEWGVRLFRDVIKYLCLIMKEFDRERIQILPSIAFDSHEVNVFIYSTNERDVLNFVKKAISGCSVQEVSSLGGAVESRVLEQIKSRFFASRVRSGVRRAAFSQDHRESPSRKDLNEEMNPYWNMLTEEFTRRKKFAHKWQQIIQDESPITCLLEHLQLFKFKREFFRCFPKSHVIADVLGGLAKRDDFPNREEWQKCWDEILQLKTFVHSSTFIGTPLDLFLYYYFDKSKENIQRAIYQNPCEMNPDEFNRLFPLSAVRNASLEDSQDVKTNLEQTCIQRGGQVVEYAQALESRFSSAQGDLLEEQKFSVSIDVPLYSFASGYLNEEHSKYDLVLGRHFLRRNYEKIPFIQLMQEIVQVNKDFDSLLYASTRSTLLPNLLTENFSTGSKKAEFLRRVNLDEFRLSRIYRMLFKRFKVLGIPKHLTDSFISIVDLYNSYINDPAQFEGFIELAPVVFQIEIFFQELRYLKDDYLWGEDPHSGEKYPAMRSDQFQDQLTSFLETFKHGFLKRYTTMPIDQDTFQSPVEYTGTMQSFFLIAQGVQRALLGYFYKFEPASLMLRASLLHETEEPSIFQRNSLFSTSTFLSKKHILYPENLIYLTHEIGHTIPVSNFVKKLFLIYSKDKNYGDDKKKEICEWLFFKQDGLHKLADRYNIPDPIGLYSLVHEVVADVFSFYSTCYFDPLRERCVFSDDLVVTYVRRFWLQFSLYGGATESLSAGDILRQVESCIQRLLVTVNLVMWVEEVNDLEKAWDLIREGSQGICRKKELLDDHEFRGRCIDWTRKNFYEPISSVVLDLSFRIKKYLKIDRDTWQNPGFNRDSSTIYFHEQSAEMSNSVFFETLMILNHLHGAIFTMLEPAIVKDAVFLQYKPRAEGTANREDEFFDMDQVYLGWSTEFGNDTGDVAIHPSLGLFTCSPDARKKMFKLRATAQFSLLDIGLQSKGEIIDRIHSKILVESHLFHQEVCKLDQLEIPKKRKYTLSKYDVELRVNSHKRKHSYLGSFFESMSREKYKEQAWPEGANKGPENVEITSDLEGASPNELFFYKNINHLIGEFSGKFVVLVPQEGNGYKVYSGNSSREVYENAESDGFDPLKYGIFIVP